MSGGDDEHPPDPLRALAAALRGEPAPCVADPELWFAPDPSLAITECHHCAARLECDSLATARHEAYGVWGGRDRSERRRQAHRRVSRSSPQHHLQHERNT